MSDPSSLRYRVARGGAAVCSLALGVLVILNAQFGCDSPANTESPKSEPTKTAPAKAEPTKVEPTKAEAAKAEVVTIPMAAPVANPVAEPEPTKAANEPAPKPAAEPIYMPASKSGGDFGRMQFPGQANP